MATIQEVYLALFGRPADPIGYQYYVDATNDGADLSAVGDLSNSPEYLERFDGMSNSQMVNQIFQDLFNRPADSAGLIFYTNLLNSGEATVQDIAIRIIDGAQGTDDEIIANKVEAAQLFTDSLDTTEEILAYQGEASAEAGRTFLSGITEDDTTIPDQEAVDTAIADLPGNIGETFTLTTDIGEIITGTNADDTINAIIDGPNTTLNTFDEIDGGDGNDTANINVTGSGVTAAQLGQFTSVENVNVNTTGPQAAVDISGTDIENFTVSGGLVAANSVTVGEGQTVNADGTTIGADAAAGVTEATVNGTDGTATAITFSETDASLATVNAGGTTAATGVTITATTTTETVNVSIENDVALTVSGAAVTTIDLSGAGGDVNLDATGNAALEALTGGEGSDTLGLDVSALTSTSLTVDAGAGNDIINVDASAATADVAVSLTGGEGNDTFAFNTAVTNIGDVTNVADGLISITDFNANEDVLNLSSIGTTAVTLNNTQAANVSDEATLADAVDVAASYLSAGDTTVFDYDGNLYFYSAVTGPNFTSGDGLIEITGASVADLDGANFI